MKRKTSPLLIFVGFMIIYFIYGLIALMYFV